MAVEEKQLVVRDPTSLDNVMGLRSWARTASARNVIGDDDVESWETLFDSVVAGGRFRWSMSFFITSGDKSGGPPREASSA